MVQESNLLSNKQNISSRVYSLLSIASMSCFNIQIKPHKSWKTLSSGLRSKFRKLKNSTNHVVATTRRLTSRTKHRSSLRSYRELESNRFMTLYVDQLYAAAQRTEVIINAREEHIARRKVASSSSSSSTTITTNIHQGKRVLLKTEGPSSEKQSVKKYETVDDAWKAIVAKSPLLRVDERAEEFISKFRKDMMLQKEKSLIDYHEMITRGA